jgi:hypothetical protein
MTSNRWLLLGGVVLAIALACIANLDGQILGRSHAGLLPDGGTSFACGGDMTVNAFGANPGDNQDDSQAVQNAIDSLADAGGGTLCFEPGVYDFNSTVVMRPTADTGMIRLRGGAGPGSRPGAGTILNRTTTGTASPVIRIQGSYDMNSYSRYAHYELRDLELQYATQSLSTPVAGLEIGSTGTQLDGYSKSQISNVTIQNFPVGVDVTNTRQLELDRVIVYARAASGTQEIGLNLHQSESTNGRILGDVVIRNSEFSVGSGTRNAVRLDGSGSNVLVAGIHFTDTTLYNGDKSLYLVATNGAKVEDFWFTSGAIDATSQDGIYLEANGASSYVTGAQITNTWILSGLPTAGTGIVMTAVGGGKIHSVGVSGGFIGELAAGATIYGDTDAVTIRGVNFFDLQYNASGTVTNSGVIAANGDSTNGFPNGFVIVDNTHKLHSQSTAKVDHFVNIYCASGLDNYVLSHNVGQVAGTAVWFQSGSNCGSASYYMSGNLKY